MDTSSTTLAENLRELADQLHFLEEKLASPKTRLTGGRCLLDGEPIDVKVLNDFKAALDQTRHSVWAVLQAIAGYSGHTIEGALEEYRMQRAGELLHVLRQHVESPKRPTTAAARSFLDEVQIVAELAFRRHMLKEKR